MRFFLNVIVCIILLTCASIEGTIYVYDLQSELGSGCKLDSSSSQFNQEAPYYGLQIKNTDYLYGGEC
ncbi:hypothetical protein AKO1_011224, partial [Acrasis kona]